MWKKCRCIQTSYRPNPVLLGHNFSFIMKYFFISFLLLGFLSSHAQDTLVMKNGKEWVGRESSRASGSLEFNTEKKGVKQFKASKVDFIKQNGQRIYPFTCIHKFNGRSLTVQNPRIDGEFVRYLTLGAKPKEKKIKRDKVFNFYVGGVETVVFKPYIMGADTFTVANARSLTDGRQDARRYYKNPWTGLVNFGIGFASGYFLSYWGVLLPATYTGVYTAINPLKSKRKIRILGQRYVTDEYYRYGFNTKAKMTKLKWSAGGGVLGLLGGIGLLEYLKAKDK